MNVAKELMKLARELDSSEWAPGGIVVPSSDAYGSTRKHNGKSNIRDLVKTKFGKAISENKSKTDRKVMRSKLGRGKVARELILLARSLVQEK